MKRLEGKVALVTGAAQGIGAGISRVLAAHGAIVALTDVSDAVMETAEALRGEGLATHGWVMDVTDRAQVDGVIEKIIEEHGKIDILVNNAGIMIAKEIENTSLEEWRRVMKVNLDGVFLGTKYGIGAMKKNGGGSIINMSSVLGLVGNFDHTSAYSASKGGIRLFTKAAAVECSKSGLDYNIRVNSVHPGVIETPMATPVFTNEEFRKAMERDHPIGRLGNPTDVAYGVLYLASDESSFITGTELVIDGGWTAH
ncbi:MAG: SDR family oxidoreductase [Desulfobacteraceae bacterium]|nr:SDR family oxidoreductase [Desulfobacteraceae bacterium]